MGRARWLKAWLVLAMALVLPVQARATVSVTPAVSYTGSYTVAWTDASGGARRAYLAVSLNAGAWTKVTVTGATSKAYANQAVGTYTYKLQVYLYDAELKKELFEYETPVATVQVWKSVPAIPGPMAGPSQSGSGSYTLTWAAPPGVVTKYQVLENSLPLPDVVVPSLGVTGRPSGSYRYAVRACNGLGCSAYGTVFTVVVSLDLNTLAPNADYEEVIPPAAPPPEFAAPNNLLQPVAAGSLPGAPRVDGGAARYTIDVEVPPGRAGMQPKVALSYASSAGNGLAGVGWALSAARTIHRCPRTLEQDGANRPVMLDAEDRLCMNGRRLLLVGAGGYGAAGTSYRTEVDPFERVTLQGAGFGLPYSSFKVEHKSGQVSRFEARPTTGNTAPDTWYLTTEADPQGNCVEYRHQLVGVAGGGVEPLLTEIAYTGTMGADGVSCTIPAGSRRVSFGYGFTREDKRTTFRAGVERLSHARLESITTSVGSASAAIYRLTYGTSPATRRSLLRQVQRCAEGTCTGLVQSPTQFTYQGERPSFEQDLAGGARVADPDDPARTLRGGWVAEVVGDFDGDGRRDLRSRYYRQPGQVKLSLSSRLQVPAAVAETIPPEGATLLGKDADMDLNGDGKADLLGISEGHPTIWSLVRTDARDGIPGPTPTYVWESPGPIDTLPAGGVMVDYDGDGLVDIRLPHTDRGERIARRLPGQALTFEAETAWEAVPAPLELLEEAQAPQDLNGDGMLDLVYDKRTSGASDGRVIFFKGFHRSFTPSATIASLGGPTSDFVHDPQRRWADVNGDGLPDLWTPEVVYLNTGGAFGEPTAFSARPITRVIDEAGTLRTASALERRRYKHAITMDADADGIDELMVPTTRVPGYEYCGRDPASYPSPPPEQYTWCGADFDDPLAKDELDRSVFFWDAYKVLPIDGSGLFQMVRIATDMKARAGSSTVGNASPADSNGDGLPDVTFSLLEQTGTTSSGQTIWFGWYPNLPVEVEDEASLPALGPYRVEGRGVAPDLMMSVLNGLGAGAAFAYQPLSSEAAAPGCDEQADFYQARNWLQNPPGYVYFTSSMWAAASMNVAHGAAGDLPGDTGGNLTCYRYVDGMLNVRGRGFQGFREIISEERLAAGCEEAGIEVAGAPLCHDSTKLSPNNLRTITEFNQEFPFTDTQRRVRVEAGPAATPALLSETQTWWHAKQAHPGEPWVVWPNATRETRFDPETHAPLASTTSATKLDATRGEPTRTCSLRWDGSASALRDGRTPSPRPGTPAETPLVVAIETRTYDPPEVSWAASAGSWWLGRLTAATTTTGTLAPANGALLVDSSGALRAPTTLETGSSGPAPVACPDESALGEVKGRVQEHAWYAEDDARVGFRRKPRSVTTSARSNPAESETEVSFTAYDGHGNLLARSISARGDVDASGARRSVETTFTASADGYFTETTRNALGHVATSRFDAATGRPSYRQEVQGGPVTTSTLTPFGAPDQITQDGAPPLYHREHRCAALPPGTPACDPLEVMARQVIQAGAPTRTEYLDVLGRATRSATQAMNQKTVVARVEFSRRGHKITETAPAFLGDGEYPTSFGGYDVLGRLGKKVVARADSIFSELVAQASLTTTYDHVEHTTIIVVDQEGTRPLRLTRTFDAKGRLIETSQRVTQGGTRDLVVSYFHEPAGTLGQVVDPGGNVISAVHDDFGRKLSVSDPDRGNWTYQWDGLGRLQRQVDGRGQATVQEYDPIGRLVYRAAGQGELAWSVWEYDPAGAPGALWRESDADGFERTYSHDALQRPVRVTTVLPAHDSSQGSGARTFTMEYGYDLRYGRLKAKRYPSAVNTVGETILLEYDPLGNLLGERTLNLDLSLGPQLRRVVALSERGQVAEQRLGNCARETGEYDASTGLVRHLSGMRPWPSPTALPVDLTNCPSGGVAPEAMIRQDKYLYDRYLNLGRQEKNVAGSQVDEHFGYDELQRLSSAGRCGGAGCSPGEADTDRYEYDDLGNLTKKSDYATAYQYGTSARAIGQAGPHAVREVTKLNGAKQPFAYDLNGNMESGDGRTIDFDPRDLPIRVATVKVTTEFSYGPSGQRYRQKLTGVAGGGFGPKTVYYLDKDYELTVWDLGSTAAGTLEERTFIGPSVVALATRTPAGARSREVRFLHLDRLGSVEAVTALNVGATEVSADAHGFDPWGKPRSRTWTASGERLHPGGEPGTTSTRGFTGHEHLDATYLIHMNGRVYDYRLGRFLSVDPIISNPGSTQSINPYSYIGNNPLSGTDPTGYEPRSICEGTGRSSNCTSIQVASSSPDKKRRQTQAHSGAGGAGSRQAESNPSSAGGTGETVQRSPIQNPSPETRKVVEGMVEALNATPGTRDYKLAEGWRAVDDQLAAERAGAGQIAVADVTVSLFPGAKVFGHVGLGVNTALTQGYYPANGVSQFDTGTGWVKGEVRYDVSVREEASVTLRGTPQQDAQVQAAIDARRTNPGMYVLRHRNCANFVGDALRAGGYQVPYTSMPRKLFEAVESLPERIP